MVDGCRGTTKDGNPCAARPMPGRDVCPWHAPDLAQRRQEWSAKGGVSRSNQARARKTYAADDLTPKEIGGLLGQALRDVLRGRVEPGPVNAAANIARSLLAVREATVIEERLAELEQRAGIAEGKLA